MTTITYGTMGLFDWNAAIAVGKATVMVRFSGGAATKYGLYPATHTTSNAAVQRLIESSEHFKRGKITIVKKIDDEAASAQAKAAPKEAVDVACLEDAVEYLRELYDIPSTKLLTREAVEKTAAAHGIEFKFPEK